MIDAYKERDVAMADIPGAYLSSDMDDAMFMIFHGKMAEMMAEAYPTLYRKYSSYGKKG